MYFAVNRESEESRDKMNALVFCIMALEQRDSHRLISYVMFFLSLFFPLLKTTNYISIVHCLNHDTIYIFII